MSYEARTVSRANAQELAAWCGGRAVEEHDALDHSQTQPGVNVPVGPKHQDNVKRASLGDTILQHSNGEFDVIRNRMGKE
jgi:hypothetical protein